MATIHPSERPPLGWLVPSLAVHELSAALDFHARLDLARYGGDPGNGWAMLRNGPREIHLFEGHIPKDLLNFRGGDLREVRAALVARGLVVRDETKRSLEVLDPDGRSVSFDTTVYFDMTVYFDATAEETARYPAGGGRSGPLEGDRAETGLDLGNLSWSLAYRDVAASGAFYEPLGLLRVDVARPDAGVVLARRDHVPVPGRRLCSTCVTLSSGGVDTLAVRGGHVSRIATVRAQRGLGAPGADVAPDGAQTLRLLDPDGRVVRLQTTPAERHYAA